MVKLIRNLTGENIHSLFQNDTNSPRNISELRAFFNNQLYREI